MTPFLKLVEQSAYISPPEGWAGWLAIAFLLGLILWFTWKWRRFNAPFNARRGLLLIFLLLLSFLTTRYIGLAFSGMQISPPPGVPVEPAAPAAMILAAVSWMLAGVMLGPSSALLVGATAGALGAYWQSHNWYAVLVTALFAVFFSAAVRQRYRTPTYRLLRHPLASAILLGLLFPFVYVLTAPFTAQGALVTRLDYALTNLNSQSLVMGLELLAGGLICELVLLLIPAAWRSHGPLEPSPAERKLQTRFMVSLSPLALILVLTLVLGDWIIAGQAAREMLRKEMARAAEMAADNIPYFMETGQNLIQQMAINPDLASDDTQVVTQVLSRGIKSVPFFNQLSVVDVKNNALASYPTSNAIGNQAPVEEQMAIQMALNGIPFQAFTIPPTSDQTTAQVSFVAAIPNTPDGELERVLVGHSDLASNPFTLPILSSLNNLADGKGQGMLVDENGRILVNPDPQRIMTLYDGRTSDGPLFYDGSAWDGSRQLFYYQPAKGRPWAVVLTVPASQAQEIALSIAAPLLAMIALLTLLAYLLVRFSLSAVTHSLQNLTGEAGRLAEGRLDRPVTVDSVDEVGQLSRAFEQMRASLKARLDELNRLLLVSQGVASSLEVSEAVQPVLDSALTGSSAARIVLTPAVLPDLNGRATPVSFGSGPSSSLYGHLDEQILALTRQQDRLVLSNLYRPRLLNLAPGAPRPESLIAVALRHENQYYGALWVAYDQPHTFSEEEVRFLVTLGGQAALAAANARLFMNAEIGRRRLESILASSPDPILVTDQRDCLLLANPAASQVLGLGLGGVAATGGDGGEGRPVDGGAPIDSLVSEPNLIDLLRTPGDQKESIEVTLPNGRIYLATATSVLAEGQRVGRVCVLRDITHFKELDALKSEFVSTVSHDLRSPLTLMRGYATMLEMVGQLNEQQTGYVRKIVGGVESMSRLVNNLLNLGRIEAGVGLQLEMIPVQDVVERVVNGLQLSAAQKHITLSIDIPKQTIPLIEADQALLQQALQNLVENAIKFTRPEGKVMVRVQVQPIGMVFQVIDNGVGISPMDMDRLFEKFYVGAQQGTGEARGTGLGLAIVKSIAERHGGRAWAESQLGKGSTFYIAIPLKQSRRLE